MNAKNNYETKKVIKTSKNNNTSIHTKTYSRANKHQLIDKKTSL
jgi:hypothetical protein